mgnify:CR=1 FL=1
MKKATIIMSAMVCLGALQAQTITVQDAVGQMPETFVRSHLVGGAGVYVYNVKHNNSPSAISSPTIGTFDANGYDSLHMGGGVILCSANVDCAPGFGDDTIRSTAGLNAYYVDPEVHNVLGMNTSAGSCSTLDFDFACTGDTFSFSFVFASDRYPDWTCSFWNDLFVAFVTGPNPGTHAIETHNVACIPGTTDATFPDGIAVSVNTVNQGSQGNGPTYFSEFGEGCRFDFSDYYREDASLRGILYRGYTVKFSVGQRVIPFQTYHMHLSLAGSSSGLGDCCAVFIEGNSLQSPMVDLGYGRLLADTLPVPGRCGVEVPISLAQTAAFDYGTVHFAFGGDAVYGVDYEVVDDHGRDLAANAFYVDNIDRYFTVRAMQGAVLDTPKYVEVYVLTQLNAAFPLATYDTLRFRLEQGTGVALADTTIVCSQACFEVGAELVAGEEPVTYRWEPTTGLVDPYSRVTAAAIFESCEYHLIATGGTGCNSDTATVQIVIMGNTPEPPVGIGDTGTGLGTAVRVWPNPTQDVIHVEAEGLSNVEVYSLDGRLVAGYKVSADSGRLDIPTEGLASGTYGLRVSANNGITGSKIVVNK